MDLVVCSTSNLVADVLSTVVERAGHSVVGQVSTIEAVVSLCEVTPVDGCVVDVDGLSPSSRHLLVVLRSLNPDLHLVGLVDDLAQADGYATEGSVLDRLVSRAMSSADLVAALDGRRLASPGSRNGDVRRTRFRLSPAEKRVLAGLCVGADTREIAQAFGISESTVRSHVRAIFDKLGVHSRVAAVLLATTLDLCQPGLPPLDIPAPIALRSA